LEADLQLRVFSACSILLESFDISYSAMILGHALALLALPGSFHRLAAGFIGEIMIGAMKRRCFVRLGYGLY
jgi:hypothetical protein